jgi:hypothetical protein
MQLFSSMKVGLVGVFACLALLLGLFSSAGTALAHSTNTLHHQTSLSRSVNTVQDARCRTIIIRRFRFRGFEDEENGDFVSSGNVVFFLGERGIFSFPHGRREFHEVFLRNFERVTILIICKGQRFERFFIRKV